MTEQPITHRSPRHPVGREADAEEVPQPLGLHDLMTTADVADFIRASESTVRYWRFCGSGPNSFRVGRRVLYRRCEVERWVDEKEHAATPTRAG